jgi:putative transposase
MPSRHQQVDEALAVEIHHAFVARRHVYGSPRVHAVWRHRGVRCSRKRVARLMRLPGRCAARQRRCKPRTTDSQHASPIAPNRLERDFTATAPNRKGVADSTATLDPGRMALFGRYCAYLFAPGGGLCHGPPTG